MTPDEFFKELLGRLQTIEGEKPPETQVLMILLQNAIDSDDAELKTKTMQEFVELGLNLAQSAQPQQKEVKPLPPDLNYPMVKKGDSTWARVKQTYSEFSEEYAKYKEWAIKGVTYGAIFLGVLTIISFFFSWDTTGEEIVRATVTESGGVLQFLHLDYIFIYVLYFRGFALFFAVAIFLVIFSGEDTEGARAFFKKFGVEGILIFTFIRTVLVILGIAPSYRTEIASLIWYHIALAGILSFLGWCAIWGLVAYYLFQRAKVGDEAKLYFATFGIELVINTIRLYFIFIVMYIPIFIGVIIYIVYQNADKTWANVPYEVAGFWGWWIPAILGSINLAMSLGIFFGWNAPVSGIKLSFDSRDMTSEEKDYMIGFYRRLVESGRGDEQVFKSWNVIESSGVFAFTYGANIFISRGAFQEKYFNALVAHEIGHLHQRDGLILQALHSFTYPLFNHLLFNPTTIQKGVIEQEKDFNKSNSLLSGIISSMTITFFTLIFGGWSVQSLARFWSKFYINRDYMADDYAVSLGFAGELLNYLDSYKDFDTALPLFNRWRGYTRVRIERIRVKIEMSY